MLLENPSTYVAFANNAWSEPDFIKEIVRRTCCALLLDVNNVHISANNQGWDAPAYIEALPLASVQEIHLAGHTADIDDAGRTLLIDTHDAPVAKPVWALFAHTVTLTGRRPTLIEWDARIPPWPVLQDQARKAEEVMTAAENQELRHVALG
jgi:hypothetical protein